MDSTETSGWSQHRLQVRTPDGHVVEVDMRGPDGRPQAVCQPKLAVRLAHEFAAFLGTEPGVCSAGYAWAHDCREALVDLGVDPGECVVQVVRPGRLVPGPRHPVYGDYLVCDEPGAENGQVVVLELPVAPRPFAAPAVVMVPATAA